MLKDKAIYSVKHFVASRPLGEFSAFIPVEHFVSSNKKPSISQVVKALEIDYEPSKGESITIHSLHVIPID